MSGSTIDEAVSRAGDLLGRSLELDTVFTAGQHALTLRVRDESTGALFVVREFPSGDDAVTRELKVMARLGPISDLAPRLIASDLGYGQGRGSTSGIDFGAPLIVTTALPGSVPDPSISLDTVAREMARALARIHELDSAGLREEPAAPPVGDSPIALRAQAEWEGLDLSELVLTHFDFWSGNALWSDGRLTGVVDWSGARSGPRGIDLAWCRQDLVLLGSPAAAELFLTEYEAATGLTIPDMQAWDVQAAARAFDRVETWLPNYLGIGRTDMTEATLRQRINAWVDHLGE